MRAHGGLKLRAAAAQAPFSHHLRSLGCFHRMILVNSPYGQYKVALPPGLLPGQQVQLQVGDDAAWPVVVPHISGTAFNHRALRSPF